MASTIPIGCWRTLTRRLHDICLLREKEWDSDVPFIVCDDTFMLWSLHDRHFHFLSSLFPNGFLFLHLCSPGGCRDGGTVEDDHDTAMDSSHRNGDVRGKASSSVASYASVPAPLSPQVKQLAGYYLLPLLLFDSTLTRREPHHTCSLSTAVQRAPGRPSQKGVGADVSLDTLGTTSMSDAKLAAGYEKESVRSAHQNAQWSKNAGAEDSCTSWSNPFYHYILKEWQCDPVPHKDIPLFSVLLNDLHSQHKVDLPLPLVILVNDESTDMYNWDLLAGPVGNRPLQATQTGSHVDHTEEPLTCMDCEDATALDFSALPPSGVDRLLQQSATPAPIPRAALVGGLSSGHKDLPNAQWPEQHEAIAQTVFFPEHDNDTTIPSYDCDPYLLRLIDHRFNWSLFSRRTHLCFASRPESTLKPQSLIAGEQLDASSIACIPPLEMHPPPTSMKSVEEHHSSDTTTSTHIQCSMVKVPVLPQEYMLAPLLPQLVRQPVGVSVGCFLWRILPEKFMHPYVVQREVTRHEKPTRMDDNCSVVSDALQIMLKRYGPVVAQARFDLIRTASYLEKSHQYEDAIKHDMLARRSAAWNPLSTPGPLVTMEVSWNIMDVWQTQMYPVFPSVDSASLDCHIQGSTISFRTGSGKDSYLFWMWTDLVVLDHLRIVRDKLHHALKEEPSIEDPSVYRNMASITELLNLPLHPLEEQHDTESSNGALDTTTFHTTTDPLRLSLHTYHHLPKSELLGQLKVQRRLGEGTVKRGMGHIFPQRVSRIPTSKEGEIEKASPRHHAMGPDSSTFNYGPCGLTRTDMDFSDKLWQFLRRGFDVEDMYEALQVIIDTLGANLKAETGKGLSRDASMDDTGGIHQPLLPLLRKGSSSQLASLIQIAIRGSQLRRYMETSLGFGPSASHLSNGLPSHIKNPKEEMGNIREEWKTSRLFYINPVACIDLIYEIGVEAVYRDAVDLIQKANPSISSSCLSWFYTPQLSARETLVRLGRLHKVAELASLSRAIRLPWEPTRTLLRHALDRFKSLSDEEDEGCHPLFIVKLCRQAFRSLFDHWIRRESELLFKLRIPEVVDAVFIRIHGDVELRQVYKCHQVYPQTLSTFSNDWSNDGTSTQSRFPLYLWKTWSREPSKVPRDPVKDRRPLTPVNTQTNGMECVMDADLFYSLQLIYHERCL